jgi:SAM-dependent methyltransferase
MNAAGGLSHWQDVYSSRGEGQTSWYREHLDLSLELIDSLHLAADTPAIDVGGGRSNLVDDLLARGFCDLTVLDLSSEALGQSAARLGERSAKVQWLAADITTADVPAAYFGLWHDRAVFHFLDSEAAQAAYIARATRSLRPGGYLLLATFAADGPEKCSGLPVCRYDADALAAKFATGFARIADRRELHRTPFGTEQSFTYLLLRRLPAARTE